MSIIEEMRAKDKIKQAEHDKEMRKFESEHRKQKEFMRIKVFPCLRTARALDYNKWLQGFIKAEGSPTHVYDYPLPSYFYVATGDVSLPALHGASSVSVIVPTGITVKTPDGLGHGNLYIMDGFAQVGGIVPIYSDTVIKEN